MFNFKQYDFKKYNISLIIAVIMLCIISAVCLKFAGENEGLGNYYFKRQIVGLFMGIFIIGIVSIIDYHFICHFVIFYYVGGIILLVLTKFSSLGRDHDTGCMRWIKLGIEIQPSELSKIILILTLAVFFVKMKDRMNKFSTLLISCIIMAVPTSLILIQTDLSSSMVMVFIFVIMTFAAGLSYKIIIPTVLAGIPCIAGLLWYVLQPWQKLLAGYQQDRIMSILKPENFADSGMYQQNNSIQAIASGQVYGKLIMGNDSGIKGYNYVAVNESDFIYSVIGEELGFIGGCFVIGLLAFIIIKCLITAKKAGDRTGSLIATGISAMFMFQVFANIGVATSILPNTGLPLPFLSFGLTSLLSSMITIGIIINIGMQKKNLRG